MRHRVAHRKLNRTTSHRRALRRSMVANLIEHESIVTTVPKAKAVKAFAEKLITLAKRDNLAARRRAIALLNERNLSDADAEHRTVINKLFKDLGPRFADRAGGYTRIVRLGQRRLGDGSPKAVLQFVDQAVASTGTRSRRTKKSGQARFGSAKPTGQNQPSSSKLPAESTPKAKPAEKVESDSQSAEANSASTSTKDTQAQD